MILSKLFPAKDLELGAIEKYLIKLGVPYQRSKEIRSLYTRYEGRNSTYEVEISANNRVLSIIINYPFTVGINDAYAIRELCLMSNNETPHCPCLFDYSTSKIRFQTSIYVAPRKFSIDAFNIAINESFAIADTMYSAFMMVQFGSAAPISAIEAVRHLRYMQENY